MGIVKYDGENARNFVINGQSIINAGGNKLGAVIALHDITELKQTEKMKNEFVSVVSHELRTPLTSIRGSLGLVLGGAVGTFSEKAQKLLDIANKNCDRLLLLINDILDLEKIQAGKMDFQMKTIELSTIIHEAITANKMYGENYNVDILLTHDLPDLYVKVDCGRLMQVLANLISNAVKFSPADEVVRIDMEQLGDCVRISIIDKGKGIPVEFQSRIFQKFSQADTSSTRGISGTGLGLNISKLIIEKLGGTINFKSSTTEGTTFYFDLPLVQSSADNVQPVIFSHEKFLICEDDDEQAKYLKVLLESAGYEVDIADTVAQAKKLLLENKYLAILLDLILPDQDGITFIRELRKSPKTRDIPIIVLSIIADTGYSIINGDALSVIDWLDKPVNFSKLMDAIALIKENDSGKKPHILHIEDDYDTQLIMKALLENNVHVTAVATLEDAKQMLEKQQIDAVILDLMLPDGNGIDLLPWLAQEKIAVIVYSAMELDFQYSKYVVEALVKSKQSNDDLLAKITYLFK